MQDRSINDNIPMPSGPHEVDEKKLHNLAPGAASSVVEPSYSVGDVLKLKGVPFRIKRATQHGLWLVPLDGQLLHKRKE